MSQFVVGSVTLHFHFFGGYGNPVNIHERKEPGTQFLSLRGSCVDLKKHGISNTHSPTIFVEIHHHQEDQAPNLANQNLRAWHKWQLCVT